MEKYSEGWETKNCHFVPQVYLKRFADDSGSLLVYDKARNKSFPNNIRNVGCENHLYNGIFEGKKISFENYFTFYVDNTYDQAFQKIKDNVSCYAINKPLVTNEIKELLSDFIANQILRVPSIVKKGYDRHKKTFDMVDNITSKVFKGKKLKEAKDIIEEHKSMASYKYYFLNNLIVENDYRIKRVKNILKEKIWILFKNTSDEFFITSDNPVVVYDSKTKKINSGISSNISRIIFPLSPKLCLCLLSKNYVENDKFADGMCVNLNNNFIDVVKELNSKQKENCDRFIYSKK